MSDLIKVSEIFFSPQGEGKYTGQLTAWVRFFLCNLQCQGFGQKDPCNPATYKFDDIDISKYSRLEDLPVIEYGCDSSYSWSAKYKHLVPEFSPVEIAHRLVEISPDWNEFTQVEPHLAFTGGEPLLKKSQTAIIQIVESLLNYGSRLPVNITVETNGTQDISPDFIKYFISKPIELFMSVSPKLFTVSGETNDKAICPDVVAQYSKYFPGQLKFVMANSQAAWDELDRVLWQFRAAGVNYPVYIMPVGSSREQQLSPDVTAVVEEAIRRGFNISGRMHSLLLGNGMGK